MKKIKIIQIIIVIVLLIASFYAGKLSMSKQIYMFINYIEELEMQLYGK